MPKVPASMPFTHLLDEAVSKTGFDESVLTCVRRWLTEQFVAHEYAKLGQGGHANTQVPLRRVFIDLPIANSLGGESDEKERVPFLAKLLKTAPLALHEACSIDLLSMTDQSDMSIDSSAAKANLLRFSGNRKSMRGLAATLLIGGPGQGKSTLGQLASQFHRAALLKPLENRLTTSVRELVRSFETADERSQINKGLQLPKRPLLPLQVSLPDLSSWLSTSAPNSSPGNYPAIIRFITDLPSAKGCGFTAAYLATLTSVMPMLLVLDGFDEVGAAVDRSLLVAAANELLRYLAERRSYAQVIVTTRPQGYSGEFAKIGLPLQPSYLVPLKKEEALEYARKLVYEKIPGVDEREQTFKRIKEASNDRATERLLTTPLQVTILTALVQQRGRAPRERWNLFSGYFAYTYARETERHTYASQLLRDYKAHIEQIHARVALLLQVESERTGGAAARMTRLRLKEVIESVLQEAGFEGAELAQLVIDISIAAEQRLVFLVEPEPGSFGFEIRSFQEFMSAWALTSGREAQVELRLEEISRAPIFRNVLLFAASRLYSEGSHLRDIFASKICGYLDNATHDPASSLTKAGALLALEALEEGAVLSYPRLARELVSRAAGLLTLPPSAEHLRLARVGSSDVKKILSEIIEQALLEPSSTINRFSAWVVVVEATNRNDDWAVKIGNEIWNGAEDKSRLLAACKTVSLTMGAWLRGKIYQSRSLLKPEDFIGIAATTHSYKIIEDWPDALCKIYESQRGWERRNDAIDGYLLRKVNEFKFRSDLSDRDVPSEWEPWRAAALYEISPSPRTLSAALLILAKTPKSTRDSIEWRSSWPLAACLRTARTDGDLTKISQMLVDDGLGNEQQWRKAESGWNLPQIELASENWIDGVPWNINSLKVTPPLTTMAWWVLPSDDNSEKKDIQLACAARIFDATSSESTRRQMARACLTIIREMTEHNIVPIDKIRQWIHVEPHMTSYIIPKPSFLTKDDWIGLLRDLPPTQEIGYVANFAYLIKLLDEVPIRALALRALATGVRFLHGRDIAEDSLAQFRRDIRRLPWDVASTLDGRLTRLYLGELSDVEDDKLVQDVISSSGDNELYLNSFLAIISDGTLPLARLTYLLSRVHSGVGQNTRVFSKVIHLLRKTFQKQKSRLDEPNIWDSLALPLPYPTKAPDSSVKGMPEGPIHLKKFELKDISGIKNLTINLVVPAEPTGQWVVILGPNGVGKTTLLRSIALALRDTSDPTIWPTSSLSLDWVRRTGENEERPQEATVSVSLASNEVFRTSIRSVTSTSFARNNPQETHIIPLFAYGCRRGSALGGALRMVNLSNDDGPEIASLFDETADLIHAETWLLQLEGDGSRNENSKAILRAVSDALCEILDLQSIVIRDKTVWVSELNGPELPLASLSDGYLTNAGWFIDLIARWLSIAEKENKELGENFLGKMTGLVLIDEIDLHLHPRWQVDIVARTRKILPKMSFVATTHNPLTLVGARAEEIWVLSRKDGELSVEMGKETPMLLTGGQIYSRYFGITDVYPNNLGEKLQRYTFLARFRLRTTEEEVEMKKIYEELEKNGLLPDWQPIESAKVE